MNDIIKLINNNEIVILPTDTVYGLMGKLNQENELKINIIKHSDINKKISIIFPGVDNLLEKIDNLDIDRINMIKEKLPGKYTFIVNLKKEYVSSLGFKRTDFGVRVTSNNVLQEIIKKTGPLLATSCNITGNSVCLLENEIKEFKLPYLFTENGNKEASTIIDLTNKEIKIIRA